MEKNRCIEFSTEIREKVFIYLRPSTILRCRLVNREFKDILDNPFFYLRKIRYGVKGLFSRISYENHTIYKEIQFYHSHNPRHFEQRIFEPIRLQYTTGFRAFASLGFTQENSRKEDSFTDPFKEFFEAWSIIIRNEDAMNYPLPRVPVLYLMKFDAMICAYESKTQNILKKGILDLEVLLKTRKNWDDPIFLYDKLKIYKEIINARDTCLAKSVEYRPTLVCKHCLILQNLVPEAKHLKELGRSHPNQHHNCYTCTTIYCSFDNWDGSRASKLCVLNHILELCFNHRTEIMEDCKDLLVW